VTRGDSRHQTDRSYSEVYNIRSKVFRIQSFLGLESSFDEVFCDEDVPLVVSSVLRQRKTRSENVRLAALDALAELFSERSDRRERSLSNVSTPLTKAETKSRTAASQVTETPRIRYVERTVSEVTR
jgi:hypothetical protein